ncbi:MAG: hypothetical protein FJ293_03715 [Planctomycetes bacterium]|nr:hypothetical protein [Planctomycetota bacterium]
MEATLQLRRAWRVALVSGGIALGALAALVLQLSRGGGSSLEEGGENTALFDPELRREALAELVARGQGVWDSHPDATVARLLQPNLKGRALEAITIDSNEWGLRERSFALPKPAGTTRVVILGDSFVMGYGVKAEDRVGVHLEQLLREDAAAGGGSAGGGAAAPGPIECLHFGVNTWNLVAECAFLRRQLTLVQPDLVVQIAIRNDLDDNPGARGMGALGMWWPRAPERADTFLFVEAPRFAFGTRENNWLLFGLDWESQSRFDEAGREIGRLARAVGAAGGKYLLFNSYSGLLATAQGYLARELAPEQSVPFPSSFNKDERYRNSRSDAHWNRAGHEQAALFLHEVIRTRGLLPKWPLRERPAAAAVAAELLPEAEREVAKPATLKGLLERRTIASAIDFRRIDADAAAQVHGGVIRGGLLSAYASLILRCEGRTQLGIAGRGLGRRELDGVKVAVFVDATQVGVLEPRGAEPFAATFVVPPELAAKTFVSVRFQADDFAYTLPDLRTCQVAVLATVELATP